jgi:hypothetical protein
MAEPNNPEFTSEDLARYNELIEKGEETIDNTWEKFYEGTGFKVWRAPKEVCVHTKTAVICSGKRWPLQVPLHWNHWLPCPTILLLLP